MIEFYNKNMMYERQQGRLDGKMNHFINSFTITNDTIGNNTNHNQGKSMKDSSRRPRSLSSSVKNNNNNNNNNYNYNNNYYSNSTPHQNDNDQHQEARLEIVDLSGRSLDSLPNPSINFSAICKLDLSNNHLENIPESMIARLLNIVVLDVHSNQLTSLPNSIGCLSKLKILNVSGNLLSSIPRTIENCRLLEELNANFNKLTFLPDTIGFELLNLKKLSVNSNKIALLPFSICHATALRVLDLRLNCLRSLPEDLENLINLEILNVSQNFHYLVELPYSIGLLMSLIELDVSYNKISELPTSLGCLRKLQKLKVEGNPLISPPLEVMEQGLHAVRQYMSEKINGYHKDSPKKRFWFKSLKKYGTFHGNGNAIPGRMYNYEVERGLVLPEYRPIDALASPRYNFGILSPKRFFSSPRNYFSRLR